MTDAKLLAEIILTDEQLKAIGCLVLEASHLEFYVEAIIKSMCDDETIFGLLLDRKMMDAKVDIMKALVMPTIDDAGFRGKFENLCSNIKTDITKRNTVIHGDWGAARKMSISELFEQQKQDKAIAARGNSPVKVKASDVMNLALRFGSHQMQLVMYWLEHLGNRPLRKRSFRRSSRPAQIVVRRGTRKIPIR